MRKKHSNSSLFAFPMKKIKSNLLFLTFLLNLSVFAQQSKINLQLKHTLNLSKPSDKISLFVRGDVQKIKQEVEKYGGISKLSAKDAVQVVLSCHQVERFSSNDFVKYIEYSFMKPTVLNDTMTIHNNILPAHQGASPLPTAYTGKGVVIGFIDTGIDIFHPDFQDSLGNSRILAIWDQNLADNGSSIYGYGQVWDSAAINNGSCTHIDQHIVGHGTHVSGVAAGNGLAVDNYKGAAPESNIIMVASKGDTTNWYATVVDAVEFIYNQADNYGMPCVINVSMGDYWGSHDGTEAASILIDSLVNYKSGRAFVCAAGNAGHLNWHAEHQITSDTTFTWFLYNPSSAFGVGAVYFEAWADTVDFNSVDFAFGANLPTGSYEQRGRTLFANVQNRLGLYTDTIFNDTNKLAVVDTYIELQGDKYLIQVMMQEPDSNSYYFSLLTTGNGKLDVWSASWLGVSDMVDSQLPSSSILPEIIHYQKPDSSKTMVSGFQNVPTLITVGNFNNRASYLDVDSIIRYTGRIPGTKANSSSWGPNRRGQMKPDIAATGDESIGPVSADIITANMNSTPANRAKIAFGAHHRKNGGTSMASPVVAGTVALILEKCPKATMSEIKNSLILTAKQDSFTGSVPNTGFGYGKIDAFAALNSTNYNVLLGSDIHICEGDSVIITTPNSYSTYIWSNSDTTPSIVIDTNSFIFVEVTNSMGCKSNSDTINTFYHTLPPKPIINQNAGLDTLWISTTNSIQWYMDNLPVAGANDSILVVTQDGFYSVSVTDSFSCSNYSDTVHIIFSRTLENFVNQNINIYPNPFNDKFVVEPINGNTILEISIYDCNGKVIYKDNSGFNRQKEFQFGNLAHGLYYLKIITQSGIDFHKIIYNQ